MFEAKSEGNFKTYNEINVHFKEHRTAGSLILLKSIYINKYS